MKNKKQVLKKVNLILAALLVSCMILSALASCQKTGEYIQNDNELRSIQPNDTQTVSAVTSESDTRTVDKNHVSQAAEKMASGEVNVNLSNNDWNSQLKPIAKWFYKNILGKDDTDITGSYTKFRLIAEYNGNNFKFVSYKLDNTQNTQYLSILLGEKAGTEQYTLIDGQLSDTDQYYSIKDSWDKIKKHAIFGSSVSDFPETVCSEGVKELDIASLIGKNRLIFNCMKADKNVIAILNSAYSYNENNKIKLYDWKIDYINVQAGSVISHKIKDLDESYYTQAYFSGAPAYDGYITVYIYLQKSDITQYAIEYKAKINTDSNNEDTYEKYTYEEWVKKEKYRLIIQSESGRYVNFYKDFDLYLHDNVTGKDILIYKVKSKELAYPSFFSGDTLYFNIDGFESCIGNGSYNPATNELKIYKNGISASLYCNGYIYGKYVDDLNLYRFHINSPENVETMIECSDYDSFNLFSPDYIFNIAKSNRFAYYEKANTVTAYSAADFKNVKSYDLLLPFSWIQDGIVLEDYIYLSAGSAAYDNKAYIIKIGE